MRGLSLLAWLILAAALPAHAQVPPALVARLAAPTQAKPAAPPPAALTPAQAQGVLDVLQNDQKRAQFITVLQNMAKVQAATTPTAAGMPLTPGSLGAELLTEASAITARGSADLLRTVRTLTSFTLFGAWLAHVTADPASRALIADAAWKLAVLGLGASLAQWLAWRGLARWRHAIDQAAPREDPPAPEPAPEPAPASEPEAEPAPEATLPGSPASRQRPRKPSHWGMLRRMPYVVLRLLLDVLPVGVFAVVIYGALSTPLGAARDARLIVLGLADAAIAVGGVMALVRAMLAPHNAQLRLLHMSDASAAYLVRWARRFLVVALFSYAIDQIGLLFGMYPSVQDALMKVAALILHVFALIVVLQCRRKVSRRIRAPRGAHGAWAITRNRLAEAWHVIAIFYIIALWLIFAFEVPNGMAMIWRYFIIGFATLAAARLLSIVLLGGLDRALRLRPATLERYPGLDTRAIRYQPVLRALINWLVGLLALAVMLSLLGAPIRVWVRHGTLAARVLDALATSGLVIILAFAVWEAANAAIIRHLARLARDAQTARSARLRTLLPMLRTTMLVVIVTFAALMVLSQVGINTAPLLAGAGVIGIAVGFGSQKLVQDVITGLFLLLENAMQVGDTVSLAALSGTVENLSIRTIRLRALDGSVHVIPFSAVTTVTNQTRDYAYALLDVTAGYNEEPDRIAQVLRVVAAEMQEDQAWHSVIQAPLEVMGVDKFLDNAWVLRARVKTTPSQRWAVQREFNRRLKYRFDALAIESPFTSPAILSTNPASPAPAAANAPGPA